MPFKKQLNFLLIGLIILSSFSVGWVLTNHSLQMLTSQTDKHVDDMGELITKIITPFLESKSYELPSVKDPTPTKEPSKNITLNGHMYGALNQSDIPFEKEEKTLSSPPPLSSGPSLSSFLTPILKTTSIEAMWVLLPSGINIFDYNARGQKKIISDLDWDYIIQALNNKKMQSYFFDSFIHMAIPILDAQNKVIALTLIYMPVTNLINAFNEQIQLTIFLSLIILVLGMGLSFWMVSSLLKPLFQMTKAAENIEKKTFNPEILETFFDKEDELSRLAHVLSTLGQEVSRREERMAVLIYERTRKIEKQKQDLQNAMDFFQKAQKQMVTKEKLAALSDVTSGIAQELRNPLNFVINFTDNSFGLSQDLLKELTALGIPRSSRNLVENIQINLDKILEYGRRIDNILTNMSVMSQKQKGSKDNTAINYIIEEALMLYENDHRRQDANFSIPVLKDLDPELPSIPVVYQDIARVIGCLYENSVDALREKFGSKTETGKITVSTHFQKEPKPEVVITFYDNGIGIPSDIVPKVFDPFYTTKSADKGHTGMGLSLAYDIITQQHGGEITIKSKEKEFTQVRITLPISNDLFPHQPTSS